MIVLFVDRPEVLRARHRPHGPEGIGAVRAGSTGGSTAGGRETAGAPVDLRLVDHRPRQRLRMARTPVERPSLPAIDAHNHLGPTPFSGRWADASAADLAVTLDASGIAAIVDLDGGWGDALRRELDRWAPLGERVAVFAGLDYGMWAAALRLRRGGGAATARRRRGRRPRPQGLEAPRARVPATRPDGSSPSTTPALDPLWAAAGELGVPVTIHVADPVAFFDPLDATNERYEELLEHPDWHFWPTRPPGRPDLPGLPAVRRADRRPRGASSRATRARPSSGPTSGARRRTWGGSARCSPPIRTGTWTSRPGSPSSAASRTRRASSCCASPTGSSSGPTRRPTRLVGDVRAVPRDPRRVVPLRAAGRR